MGVEGVEGGADDAQGEEAAHVVHLWSVQLTCVSSIRINDVIHLFCLALFNFF